ncbi:hypothetical protein JOF56_002798 [Kibdelosporangium banguiense]|uniref:Class I SAM-dependent methyltransferase n=1 Tax=Kibdelosporangium banguiense TaxID=1365924 RepID=A0ABS4TDB3_9PSEU|nr:hypothetical protein [Kibdelosporangium banguiense]MBP2322413.1 hypothetical protein [Kibdelosporangium banguiense]
MADLKLTVERRNELAALLDDEQRLRVEYPKVAEYLDMAPQLRGTGDDSADAAFDLRFVHYVTGGAAHSTNPYWDIVAPSIFEYQGRQVVNGGRPDGSPRLAYAQMILQATYAYAIPSPGTVEWMSQFCADRPIVEMGAGRAYWAAQLATAGLVVEAYDSEPPNKVENVSFPSVAGQEDVWHHVGNLEEFSNRVADPTDYVLFLCWPPGWGSTMASQALGEFERLGGERLVFIGEPQGGKTGDDAFFDALSTAWTLESQDEQYVSWWNLCDVTQGWARK